MSPLVVKLFIIAQHCIFYGGDTNKMPECKPVVIELTSKKDKVVQAFNNASEQETKGLCEYATMTFVNAQNTKFQAKFKSKELPDRHVIVPVSCEVSKEA